MRDINWSVDFCVSVNGYEARFSDLTENEQAKILEDIRNDFSYGTFIGDEDETED